MPEISLIVPDWPAPTRVRAVSSFRQGGCSEAPWSSLNLGNHVGDNPQSVARNRSILAREAGFPANPQWLQQVHGCVVAKESGSLQDCKADALYSCQCNQVCAVLTADCLPILLCEIDGKEVAAVHAGWRGLAGGILENTLQCFLSEGASILAWLGPAIGAQSFEVGNDVRQVFLRAAQEAEAAFTPLGGGQWLCDIYLLAKQKLMARGVTRIYGGEFCTYSDEERFFSYRRDGQTGRMATAIWITG